jgi:transcription factor IIIB subunit 2
LDDSDEYSNGQLGIDPDPEVEAATVEEEVSEMINDPNTAEHAKAFATAEQRALVHIMIQNALHPPKDVPMTVSIDDSEFADDAEVSNCLLSPAEAAIKAQIWLNANKDWIEAQQDKEFKKRLAEMGPPKATRKRIKKPRIGEGQASAASTPTEAAIDFVKNRTWSKRINYDAIKGLFEGPGSASGSATTSRLTSRAGSTVASSLAAESVASESVAGNASSAMSGDVGNAMLVELDEDLDDNWEADLED